MSKKSHSCDYIDLSIIVAQQAAEPFATADVAIRGKLRSIRLDDFVVQRLMIPFVIEVCDKRFNRLAERRLAKKDHSGQAFLPDGQP
jgi:hypothetical protein